jgi:predicted ester cyclase
MSIDELRSFFRQRQEKYDRHDARALAADHTGDGTVSSPMFPRVEGTAAIERAYNTLFRTFPDWQIHLEEAIVDGDRAAQPFRAHATHVGEFMGIAGTGRKFELNGVLVYKMRDGLIVDERRVYDFTALLLQLGILRGKLSK